MEKLYTFSNYKKFCSYTGLKENRYKTLMLFKRFCAWRWTMLNYGVMK